MDIPNWTNEQIVSTMDNRIGQIIAPMNLTPDMLPTPYALFVNRIAAVFIHSFFGSMVGQLVFYLADNYLFVSTFIGFLNASFSLGRIAEREKWFQSSIEWEDHRKYIFPLDSNRKS
jgi:hypothetical protein